MVTVLKPIHIINQIQQCVIYALNIYLNNIIPSAAIFFANKSDNMHGKFPLKWQD